MWLDGMRRLRHSSTNGIVHRVMVMQRWWLGSCWPSEVSLILHRVRSPIAVYGSHCSASYTCPRLVGGMVEQGSDVVYEERIELFGNLLFVRELKSTLEWNPVFSQCCSKHDVTLSVPDTLEMHWTYLDYVSRLLALENTISASSGHASNIEQFCAVDHVIVWECC